MSKAVLISIRPEWCEKILSGEKTLEIRKTRPKINPPFTCYIYCTKPRFPHEDFIVSDAGTNRVRAFYGGGKVIARFTCDAILPISVTYSDPNHHLALREFPGTCLTDKQIMDYLGNGGGGYAWHISDLVLYDEPRDLSAFQRYCNHGEDCFTCRRWKSDTFECIAGLLRPPQSWFYVEDQPY